MAKIEVANTLFLVCLKQFFVFPEHCAFCLCEVLTRCHQYSDSDYKINSDVTGLTRILMYVLQF